MSEELLYVVAGCALLIGAFIGGVIVFVSTAWMRTEARADRIEAAEDRADAAASRVAMESARTLLPLHPAYGDHTAEWRMVEPEPEVLSVDPRGGEIVSVAVCICPWVDSERVPTEDCPLTRHGDPWGGPTVAPPTVDQVAERLAEQMFPDLPGCGEPECRGCRRCGWDSAGTALALVDEPPVTADDLAPIGPDRLPQVPWWACAFIAAALVALTPALALAAVVALVWWGRDLAAQRRALAPVGAVVMELEHPAPVPAYDGRHRSPAGRWRWSR